MDFESGEGYIYDMFEAVFDVVHGKKPKKLKFAKCMNCGRLNPFRPKSKGTQFTAIRCNNCGGTISFGARGKESRISEHAQIFCENCEDDCTQCPINEQTSILFQENVASTKSRLTKDEQKLTRTSTKKC